ncbi:hypothetical protein J6590_050346 [Homalodisca vitripennis]|nr:hypothetical protein J6590_050346 [Homalodisca vitripennis]
MNDIPHGVDVLLKSRRLDDDVTSAVAPEHPHHQLSDSTALSADSHCFRLCASFARFLWRPVSVRLLKSFCGEILISQSTPFSSG